MFRQENFAEILNLAALLQKNLSERGLTIATAESCTGGLLAAALTELPGSSRVFTGSVVAYANEVKLKVLNIDPKLLDTEGAVSQAVAEAMAKKTALLLSADIGVGITGVAGPDGGSREKPVGTVWMAISWNSQCKSKNLALSGSRAEIRGQTVREAFVALNKLMTLGDWS